MEPDHLADRQRIVNAFNDQFVQAVATGRRIASGTVRSQIADGRLHPAAEARKLRLIDGIQSFDKTAAELGEPAESR